MCKTLPTYPVNYSYLRSRKLKKTNIIFYIQKNGINSRKANI